MTADDQSDSPGYGQSRERRDVEQDPLHSTLECVAQIAELLVRKCIHVEHTLRYSQDADDGVQFVFHPCHEWSHTLL